MPIRRYSPLHAGVLLFLLASSATAQTPTHNWTFNIGSTQFGIVSFGTSSYVSFGFVRFVVPFSAEMTTVILGLGFLLSLIVLNLAYHTVAEWIARKRTVQR